MSLMKELLALKATKSRLLRELDEAKALIAALKNANKGVELQCNQLKACVNELREVAEDALETAHGGADRAAIRYVLDQSPAQTLAEIEACAIDAVRERWSKIPLDMCVHKQWILDGLAFEARQLRQRAQESRND